MAKRSDVAQTADAPPPSEDQETYRVGYGRPPLHSRVKPGQILNPRGRPKGQCNVGTVLRKALNERTKIRQGNRTRSVTKLDYIILRMVADAGAGNPKARTTVITLVRDTDQVEASAESKHQEPLTADDQAVIADFLQRNQSSGAEPHQDEPADKNSAVAAKQAKP